MARPAKAVDSQSSHLTKEEIEIRTATEKKLKGNNDNLEPADYLNKRQKEIFYFILENLEKSQILGNIDVFILNQAAISMERLECLERLANNDLNKIFDSSYKSIRDMYSKDFFRCCNELCLSPQSRAKLSISASKQPKKKTLKDILGDDDE